MPKNIPPQFYTNTTRCLVLSQMLLWFTWLLQVAIWVTVAYLCSKQSHHSPLTSEKGFSFRQLVLNGYFHLFGPFSVTSRDDSVEKSNSISSFINPQTSSLAATIMLYLKSLKSPFFPILMLSLNVPKPTELQACDFLIWYLC